MTRNNAAFNGYTISHEPGADGDHQFTAHTPEGEPAGIMHTSENLRYGGGNIDVVVVHDGHQRKGVATALGRKAMEIHGTIHHTARTGQGAAWAAAFDKKVANASK